MSYRFGHLNDLAYKAFKNSKDHGFWDEYYALESTHPVPVILSKLALITSEVGEAIEAVRKDDRNNLAEELADICIRVFDLAEALNINLEQSIVNKMQKNEARPYMHGKLA